MPLPKLIYDRFYLEIVPVAVDSTFFSDRYWLLINSGKHRSYSDFHLKGLWQAHFLSSENREGKKKWKSISF